MFLTLLTVLSIGPTGRPTESVEEALRTRLAHVRWGSPKFSEELHAELDKRDIWGDWQPVLGPSPIRIWQVRGWAELPAIRSTSTKRQNLISYTMRPALSMDTTSFESQRSLYQVRLRKSISWPDLNKRDFEHPSTWLCRGPGGVSYGSCFPVKPSSQVKTTRIECKLTIWKSKAIPMECENPF